METIDCLCREMSRPAYHQGMAGRGEHLLSRIRVYLEINEIRDDELPLARQSRFLPEVFGALLQ
jgi:hypothetical protein